jgi:ubiquinone/menaquinone biosynthesis C-methylase UbiE
MHPKLLKFRYKLFRYRHVEQEIARQTGAGRMLDIGCGDGENLLRFNKWPLQRVGLEISMKRLRQAKKHGLDVLQGSGTTLPFPDKAFHLVYIAHVLHHILSYDAVLEEMKRVTTPDGKIFVVETVTDNPLLRLGRNIHPVWQGDEVEAEWRFADLVAIFETAVQMR